MKIKKKILKYSWELVYENKEKRYPDIAGNLIVKIKKKILTYSWELVYENKEKRYPDIAGNLVVEIKKKRYSNRDGNSIL